jgi:hypothetical protein
MYHPNNKKKHKNKKFKYRNKNQTINSCGCNLFERAFCANELTSKLILAKPFLSALKTIGVMRPFSVATATHISTFEYL